MTDLAKTFEAIHSELAALLAVEDHTSSETIAMTPEQFVGYVALQVELAKNGEDVEKRVEHLSSIVSLAKMESWEDTATIPVRVFTGELSVEAQSAYAERMEKLFSVPGPQATPAGGAMETAASGPTGPASNTASPAARIMPPAFPQSTPTTAPEGFMAKAAAFKEKLAKAEGAKSLLQEFEAMLDQEPAQATNQGSEREVEWPHDLSTAQFLAGQDPVSSDDDFGSDPKPGEVLH